MVLLCIILALIFDFLNGFNDSASLVASVVSTRALTPRWALRLAAVGEFAGPLVFGVAVAQTIGANLLAPEVVSLEIIAAGLLGAISWNLITWYFGIPSSSSHALVGGLIGPALLLNGLIAVKWTGILKVILALTLSPPLGIAAGYLFTKLVYFLTQNATPRVNDLFRAFQVVTSFGLSLSHGANDAQKTMGVITLVLVTSGQIPEFAVPPWVVLAAAAAIALGTSVGGWRQIKTLGGRIFRIRPINGFSAQLGGAGVIAAAAFLGGPVSTTQVMSAGILGSGAAERLSKVRWNVGREMLIAWLLTIPSAALLSLAYYGLLTGLLRGIL